MRIKREDEDRRPDRFKARRPNRCERELNAELERKMSVLSGHQVRFVRPRGRKPQREVFTEEPSLFELDFDGLSLYECVVELKACCRPIADREWNEIVKRRMRSCRVMQDRRSIAVKRQALSLSHPRIPAGISGIPVYNPYGVHTGIPAIPGE